MKASLDIRESLTATWRTNARITALLIESLPPELWSQKLPGAPRRTVRMMAGHINNARCMWIKIIGEKSGISVPKGVNRQRVKRDELLAALQRSSDGVVRLLDLGLDRGGKLPRFPLDVVHFLAYLVAHEAHHRGQIVMVARQLGQRLPTQATTTGLWDWSKRAKEAGF